MRPGQNKRMRGRNNRKGPNPLTRSYESNGPDVKIRGTAHHVAEKYLQLARDAQSSGDPVMAENYLQHAEHYFRIIAAAQQAQQQAQAGYVRQPGEPEPEEVEDDDDGGIPDRFASPIERQPAPPPQQPYHQPSNQQQPQGGYNDRQFGGERPQQEQRPYQDRGPRPDRPYQDRNQNPRHNPNRGPRDQRPPRDFRSDQQNRFEPRVEAKLNSEEEDRSPALPSFITAPVRGQSAESARIDQPGFIEPPAADAAPREPDSEEAGKFHLRNRRRRRPSAAGTSDQGAPQAQPGDEVPAGE
jgi:hypothetical protein